MKKIVLAIFITCGFLIGGYFILTANNTKPEALPLREYTVFKGDITAGISSDGYLYLPCVSHYFDAPVQLETLFVNAGDVVETGDKIAKAVGNELADPYLYAKLDGIVLSVLLAEGEMTAGRPVVAQIGDPKKITACLPITQASIGDVEIGQLVEFTLNAYPAQVLRGTVSKKQSAPISGSNPVMYAAYATIETQDLPLLEGMTFSAQLIQKQVEDVLCLSNKAIHMKDGKQFVLIKDADGNLRENEIQTGFSDGRYSEIVSGLSENDVVYVEG